MKKYVLGISCYYHDSAAALLRDGEILGAVQEERFSRLKNDSEFPAKSIQHLLNQELIKLTEIDEVVYYEKPFLTFERLMASHIQRAPGGFQTFLVAIPLWLKKKLFLKNHIEKALKQLDADFEIKNLYFSEHHLSHAAGTFFTSGFDEAIILVMDGVGEWTTTTVAVGRKNEITIEKEIHFPHSLGLIYSAFTSYLGFQVNEGEYKMMGLAPYGQPRFAESIRNNLIDIKEDGSFRLNMKFFNFIAGLEMTNKAFHKLFGQEPRGEAEEITVFHADIAASIQSVTEEVILKIGRSLAKEYGVPNLCLAGGVALNCVANGKLADSGYFKKIWIQPASGDAGGALGAALAFSHIGSQAPRNVSREVANSSPYLGPEYSQSVIEKELNKLGAKYVVYEFDEIIRKTASELADGKVIGWFQDRLEFGPRALGNRSILADPTKSSMQHDLNMRIKYREGFRPFAPAVIAEKASEWFDINFPSPYMLFVRNVSLKKIIASGPGEQNGDTLRSRLQRIKSVIPAVTHVDHSARVQTVTQDLNPKFYLLLQAFEQVTGCPLLVNTSMNVRGEPIVCSPADAFQCFLAAKLDFLVIGNCLLTKSDQFKHLPLFSST